jgi:hypothetical protein
MAYSRRCDLVALARLIGMLWPSHHLLQRLREMAEGWCMAQMMDAITATELHYPTIVR